MQEPAYDPQRLQIDRTYQYGMVDEFTAYMESLPDYADRVRYFMRICSEIRNGPQLFNIPFAVCDRLTMQNAEGRTVDKDGNKPNFKWLDIPAQNHMDKAIRRKLYFTDYYKSHRASVYGFDLQNQIDLRATYLQKVATSANPEALRNAELNTVCRTIANYQTVITAKASTFYHSDNERVIFQQQLEQASQIVEDELAGSPAIRWEIMNSFRDLEPFLLLWDITAYKLFLEQPQPINGNTNQQNSEQPLPHAQICLICIAQKRPISQTNKQIIAEEFGIKTPNAGKVLKEKYDELDDNKTRRNHRDIEKHLEAIKKSVSKEGLQWIENELDIIRNKKK